MPKYKRKHVVHPRFVNVNWKAILEADKLKKASFAFRHDLLLNTQRINFQNEKDCLLGMLDHSS